jgi:SNF2 family DNA or RNA helicase
LELPKTIRAELRPYQRKGFEWMVLLNEINAGACLADDMGLGKTLQTITFMAHQAEQNEAAKMLVVCPASLLYNWKNEIEKFAPNFKTLVHYGPQRDFKVFLKGDYDVLICSYHTARMDEQQLSSLIWDVLVLDESHNIRSMKAQMTQAVHRIRAHSNVILSGTPMVNNTFDLFAQFEVILPGLFGGQDFFNSTYATPIDKHRSTHAIQNLNKLTKPFILRRTKKQVATDLPEKIESIIYCEMNPDQREAYETVKAEVGKSVFLGIEENGLEKSKLSILQAISKLRMLCCLPKLLDSGAFDATSSVKLDMLLEEIERNLGNHKVLVFSQYLGMLDAISNELTTRNIAHFRFDGSTPAQKRMLMVDAFQQEDSQERIFLVSLKAGNTGITLTEADYVFLVDPWWNEAIQRQAIDRTHRIGQKKTVFAYKMICKDSLEERMLALQQRKQFISDELIVEDENIVKNLTLEDISFLFG